jgi:hypothetical protein
MYQFRCAADVLSLSEINRPKAGFAKPAPEIGKAPPAAAIIFRPPWCSWLMRCIGKVAIPQCTFCAAARNGRAANMPMLCPARSAAAQDRSEG